MSRLYIIQLQPSREVYVISSKYRVLRSRVLPDQEFNSIYVTQLNVWTSKDSFFMHLRDVPVLYQYTYRSPVDQVHPLISMTMQYPQVCQYRDKRAYSTPHANSKSCCYSYRWSII